ncbi:heavy-metal-associated domain-containing protein [Streptomyces sp. P9(2023)]|uniref:heavy-metal-associated domain-containing protein n=1 Tax=Streptomyces sp. P9(2023) TaxID=3064394 RepID=UPI0028F42050|nr:heavy-metal-associated domain-containing protein [Streptomyces sp. P9(2023)]MDT9692972.1 heavy-metal-associated domain-containing protein [Streptomyces sp. P9(2023)]
MSDTTYTVTGMTCGHCGDAITKELSDLPGVRKVDVDVPSGRVTVTSDSPLATEDVRAAIVEAGEYELVAS